MNIIKCIRADICRVTEGGAHPFGTAVDCSNGGISSTFDHVIVPVEGGYIEIDTDTPPENLVRIVRRNIFGREYVHVEPWENAGRCFMAGGTFVYSCDSRFSETINNGGYPVSLHDRTED